MLKKNRPRVGLSALPHWCTFDHSIMCILNRPQETPPVGVKPLHTTNSSRKAPLVFRDFDECAPVRIYHHGILPHWRQDGCSYFVTFRLADSLPRAVILQMEADRVAWLRSHGIDPRSSAWRTDLFNLGGAKQCEYERTIATSLNDALDMGIGSCALRDAAIGQIVADSLEYFHGTRVETGDYAVMPNHVHAILKPLPGFELEQIIHSIKSYTANEINLQLGNAGTFWQRESYDRIVRDFQQLERFVQYIQSNPDKAQLGPGESILARAAYVEAA